MLSPTQDPPLLRAKLSRANAIRVMVLRIMAFIMDVSLVTLFTLFILVRVLLPEQYSDAIIAFNQAVEVYSAQVEQAAQEDKASPAPPEISKDERIVEMFAYSQGLMILTLWLYFAASEIFLGSSTLGKKTFGLITLSTLKNESKPRLSQNIVRSGLKSISIYSHPVFLINYIVAFFTKDNRAIHDLLCRTKVCSRINLQAIQEANKLNKESE